MWNGACYASVCVSVIKCLCCSVHTNILQDNDEVICSTSSSSAGVSCAGDGEVWEVCPVCGVKLPDYALELHASVCANDRYSPTDRVVVID